MVWSWGVAFQVVVACMIWVASGAVALCDIASPITETAYVGSYEIQFPESSSGTTGPSRCRWLISAYRKDYVIRLEFDDVDLEKNSQDACVQDISVYDGSTTTNNIISTFCGTEQPRLVTSSRTALIVFSSDKSSVQNGTFKLKYRAVKDRQQSGDTGQILRIAFGAFLGAISCIVVFSWVYRKYKQEGLGRGVFIFGRGRTSSGHGQQNVGVTARNVDTRVTGDRHVSLQRKSFKNKVAGFFQDVVIMLSPRRMTVDSLSTESADNVSHQQQHQPRQQQQHNGGASLQTLTNSSRRDAHAANISRNPFPAAITNTRTDSLSDHVTYGYPMVPLNSFTSDPDAVRPPTYEDSIKSVNPLYLHNHGRNMFYNMAFTLKDEVSSCAPILSPPPPYTEVGCETPQAAWSLPSQIPPQYEAISPSSAATTPDHEITGYDSSVPEQSCERGETVICVSPSQERPVVLTGRMNTANATTLLTDSSACESLVAATIVQPIAIFELPSHSSSSNYGDLRQPAVEIGGTSAVPEVPGHVPVNNASVVSAVTSAPVELLRRSGFLSSHSTDRLIYSENSANPAATNEGSISQNGDPNLPSHCDHDRNQV